MDIHANRKPEFPELRDQYLYQFFRFVAGDHALLISIDIRLQALRAALVDRLGEEFNASFREHRDRLLQDFAKEHGKSLDEEAPIQVLQDVIEDFARHYGIYPQE
jgi:hypothetical protein